MESAAALESARMKERAQAGPAPPSVSLAARQDILEQSNMAGDSDWGYAPALLRVQMPASALGSCNRAAGVHLWPSDCFWKHCVGPLMSVTLKGLSLDRQLIPVPITGMPGRWRSPTGAGPCWASSQPSSLRLAPGAASCCSWSGMPRRSTSWALPAASTCDLEQPISVKSHQWHASVMPQRQCSDSDLSLCRSF